MPGVVVQEGDIYQTERVQAEKNYNDTSDACNPQADSKEHSAESGGGHAQQDEDKAEPEHESHAVRERQAAILNHCAIWSNRTAAKIADVSRHKSQYARR